MALALVDLHQPLPGCGATCRPDAHDPYAHELYGLGLALVCQRVGPPPIVRSGPLELDLTARRVAVGGVEVALSGREWELLVFLASPVGRFRSNEEILLAVFGVDWILGHRPARRGTRVDSPYLHHVDLLVHRLRRKLGDAGRLVVTATGGSGEGGRRLAIEEPTP
jgi:hypothetical protein